MVPLKTSQFAELYLFAEKFAEGDPTSANLFDQTTTLATAGDNGLTTGKIQKVGIVTTLRISENLNSNQRNVIGTPVPIFMPGYYQATISAQKATLDLSSFKTMLNLNPMTAFDPSTYANSGTSAGNLAGPSTAELKKIPGLETIVSDRIPRFTFIVLLKDAIASTQEASPSFRPNMVTGAFVCMLRSFNISLSSQDAIIMEDVEMLGRPIAGSWFAAVQGAFETDPALGYIPSLNIQK